MNIVIGEKIRPFSHTPGMKCIVPGSNWIVQPFPALLRLPGLDLPLEITGPIKEFTVQLDLEKNCVWVWGQAKEGLYKYRLEAMEEGLTLAIDRVPKGGLIMGGKTLMAKEKILLASGGLFKSPSNGEKISLGNLKAQDWDLVSRRMDLAEIVPALFLLGQKVPPVAVAKGGVASLLASNLDLFVRAGFTDLLIPHLKDEKHRGISPEGETSGDPLSLLTKSYQTIRSFLIEENNPIIRILPHLPKEWDCGRSTDLCVSGLGEIDLEWTKGLIRRVVIRPSHDAEAKLVFAKPIVSFRCNGKSVENGSLIGIQAGKSIHLDRFQK